MMFYRWGAGLLLGCLAMGPVHSQVGIGTITVDASAILQLNSGSRGLLLPRLGNPGADVTGPVAGLVVYNTTANQLVFYNGSAWVPATSQWATGAGGIISYSAGDVGIGTATPAARLHVEGAVNAGAVFSRVSNTGTGNGTVAGLLATSSGVVASYGAGTPLAGLPVAAISISTNHPLSILTNSIERLRVGAAGNVQIGEPLLNPQGTLSIIRIDDDAEVDVIASGATVTPRISMFRLGTGGGAVGANQSLGALRFRGFDGTDMVGGAVIQSASTETYTPTSAGSVLTFSTTASGATTPTERMRINAFGHVGIGSTNPQYPLHVRGTIATGEDGLDGELRMYSEQGATDYDVFIRPNAAMTSSYNLTLPPDDGTANQVLSTDGNGNLSWAPAGGGSQWIGTTDIYYSAGNVGIGTTTPGAPLDIISTGILGVRMQTNSTSNRTSGLQIINNNTTPTGWFIGVGGTGGPGPTSGELYFATAGGPNDVIMRNGVSGAETMRFTNTGRIGIGVAAPINPLDVRGGDPLLVNIRRDPVVGSDFSAVLTLTNGNTTPNGWQMAVGGTGNGLGLVSGEMYLSNGTQLPFVLRNGAAGAETFRVTGTGAVVSTTLSHPGGQRVVVASTTGQLANGPAHDRGVLANDGAGALSWVPTIPVGGIIMTNVTSFQLINVALFDATGLGTATGPYRGWAVCNGNNGTLDLSDRFVMASGATAPLNTGGTTNHNHTVDPAAVNSGGNSNTAGVAAILDGDPDFAGPAHTHNVDIPNTATTTTNHLPPFIVLVYLQRIL